MAIRLAVPFFFIVSGYFAYKIINSPDKLRVRGMKMLRIWAIWMLIYFPLQLYSGFPDAKSVVVYIINVLLYGEEAYAWPLWFLYAQAIFFLIESFLPNRQRLRARSTHYLYLCFGCIVFVSTSQRFIPETFHIYSSTCLWRLRIYTLWVLS